MAEHIELTDDLVATRRHLHETPELSFKEVNTTAFLADKLRSLGVEVLDSPLETGVIGLIRGEHDGPRVGLRADIDGLPVIEESGLDFASHNQGVMHLQSRFGALALTAELVDDRILISPAVE